MKTLRHGLTTVNLVRKQELARSNRNSDPTIPQLLAQSEHPLKTLAHAVMVIPLLLAVVIGGSWFIGKAGHDPLAGIVFTFILCLIVWAGLREFDKHTPR